MKKRLLWILMLLILIPVLWGFCENNLLQVNEIFVTSAALPAGFDGYRIAHVSDLHNAEFGENNGKLLQMLREAQPDIIAITGDVIDSRKTDMEVSLAFVTEAVKIAPCYYVTGNHEARIPEYADFEESMTAIGVTVLRNEALTLQMDGQQVCLMGLDDPTFGDTALSDRDNLAGNLDALATESFTILLSHRPEHFDLYCQYGMDLVLSGHVHGGQIRIPFLGGLIGPHQGFFPQYDAGLYTQGTTNMIVSRGLGNSLFPFRLNNPPELIIITLQK